MDKLLRRFVALAIISAFLSSVAAQAQQQPAGVVTTLQGNVELTRPTQPLPTSLKFRDNIFVRDTINTKEKSVARVLFGGKSSVTVRELSRLEVREENLPGGTTRTVHDLSSGAILVNVARELMRPGDEVVIRTPNAVAAVRGSILYVGFNPATNQTLLVQITGNSVVTYQGGPTIALPPSAMTTVNGSSASGVSATPVAPAPPVVITQLTVPFTTPTAPVSQEPTQQQTGAKQAQQATELARAVVTAITGVDPGGPGSATTVTASLAAEVTGSSGGSNNNTSSPPSNPTNIVADVTPPIQELPPPPPEIDNLVIAGAGIGFSTGSTQNFATINQSGGTLTGSDTVNANSFYGWTGGTQSGTGTTNIASSATLDISGEANKTLDTRTLNNAGTANISGSLLTLTNNAQFINTGPLNNAGGIDIQSGAVTLSGGGTSTGSFSGAGTLNVSGGNYTFAEGSSITNSNVNFSGGTATIQGTYNLAGSNTSVSGGTANFTGTSTVGNVGNLTITSGTANFTSGETIAPTSFSQSGGTLTGSDQVNLSGNSNSWTGGTQSGSGTTNVQSEVTLGISGAVAKTLDTRPLSNTGTLNFSAGSLNLNNSAVVSNSGNFNVQGTTAINSNAGTAGSFNNPGNFNRGIINPPSADTTTTTVSVPFHNTGTAQIHSGTLSLAGGGTDTGSFIVAGGGVLNFSGGTHNLNSGTTVTGAGSANVTGGTVVFNNGASITNAGGFNNNSAVQITGGTLSLSGGGTNTGTMNVSGGATLSLATGAPHTGVFNVSGTLDAANGLVSALSGQTLNPAAAMINVTGGNLNASGATSIFNLTGGALNLSPANSTLLNMTGGSTSLNSGFSRLSNGSQATVNSLFSLSGSSSFTIANDALLNVAGGSVFKLTSNSLGLFGAGTNTLSFGNAPLCGTSCVQLGSTGFNVLLANGALLTNISLDPSFTGFTGLSGTNTIAGLATGGSRALIVLDGAASQLQLGQNLSQPLNITSGTTDFSGGGARFFSTASISSGTLTGSDAVNFAGLFDWTAGSMLGTGNTTANGGMTLSGSTKSLGRTLVNPAGQTAIWTAGDIHFQGTATFTNQGTFRAAHAGDLGLLNGGGFGSKVFDNQGLFIKEAPAVGTVGNTVVSSPIAFNNSGSVQIQAGAALQLFGGGTSTGSFSGTGTLNFAGFNYTIAPGSSVTTSNVEFNLSTNQIQGTYDLAGSASTKVTGGTNIFTGTVGNVGSLTVSGGTGNFSAPLQILSLPSLTLSNGTVTGSQRIEIGGLFNWSGGNLLGSESAFANAGMTLSGGANKVLGRTLVNPLGQTAQWTGGNIGFQDAATLTNLGTFRAAHAGNQSMFNGGGIGTKLFDNQGTFIKEAPATGVVGETTISSPIAFNNSGSVEIQAGSLKLVGGGTANGGSFSGAGTLEVGGNYTFQPNSSITTSNVEFSGSGAANIQGSYDLAGSSTKVSSGTANFTGTVGNVGSLTVSGGTGNFSAPLQILSLPSLTLSNGTVTGSQRIEIGGLFNWSGGNLLGSESAFANAGMTLSGGANKVLGRTLVNPLGQTAQWTGGNIGFQDAATLTNLGTFRAAHAGNQSMFNGGGIGTKLFDNQGTFIKEAPATGVVGETTISSPIAFNNSGSVEIQAGSLKLVGGGTANGGSFSGAGTLEVGGNYTFQPNSSITTSNVEFSGSGAANIQGSYDLAGSSTKVSSGTANFTGTVGNVGSLTVSGGTGNFSAPLQILSLPSLTLSNGTVTGSQRIEIGGLFNWSGGNLLGSESAFANAGMTLSGGANKVLGRTLVNPLGQTAQWTGGNIGFQDAATLTNLGTFRAAHAGNQSMFNGGGIGTKLFDNQGTFIKEAPATGVVGETTISSPIAFNNSGTVNVEGGTLNLNNIVNVSGTGTYNVQTGGTLNVANSLVHAGAGQTFNQAASIANVTGGTLNATGATSLLNLTGGTLNAAAGNSNLLNVAGGGAANLNSGFLRLSNGSSATVQGLFSVANGSLAIANDALMNVSGGSTFRLTSNSLGTFGAGNNQIDMGNAPVCGTSCVSVGYPIFDSSTNILFTNGATAANITADYNFRDFHFEGNSSTGFSGVGGQYFNGGRAVITLDGSTSQLQLGQNLMPILHIPSGVTNFSSGPAQNFSFADISAGTLTGSDTVNILGYTQWSGGSMTGSGVTNANRGITISGPQDKLLDVRTLNVDSQPVALPNNFFTSYASVFTGGTLYLNNGAALNNIGNFVVRDGGVIDSNAGEAGVFNNFGFLEQLNGGTTTINARFNNQGAVNVQNGTLALNNIVNDGATPGSYDVQSGATLNTTGSLWTPLNETSINPSTSSITATGGTININNRDRQTLVAAPGLGGQPADSIAMIRNEKDTSATLERAYIPVPGNGEVKVIDATTNLVINTVSVGTGPTTVAATPDNDRIFVLNSGSNNVSIIDVHSNATTALATLTVGSAPEAVVFTPDSSRAYITNAGSNNVTVINKDTNTVLTTVTVGINPSGADVTPDGTKVYVANAGSNNVSVINTATNTVIATVNVGTEPTGLAVSPDGTKVGVANRSANTVSVINTATNTVIATIPVGDTPSGGTITANGKWAYISNFNSNDVSVIDLATSAVIATIPVGTNPKTVVASSDSRRVYVANEGSNSASVIDTATNTVVATIDYGSAPVALALTREIPGLFNLFSVNEGSTDASVVHVADTSDLVQIAGGALVSIANSEGSSPLTFGGSVTTTTVNTAGTLLRVTDPGSQLNVQGPLLSANNTVFNVDRGFLRISGGGTVFHSESGLSALYTLTGTTPGATTVNTVTSLFNLQDFGSLLLTNAPLLNATNSNFFIGPNLRNASSFLSIEEGAAVVSTAATPFISLTNSAVARSNNFFSLRRRDAAGVTASMSLNGSLADLTGSSVTTNRSFAQILEQGTLIQNGSNSTPLIKTTNSVFNIGDPALGASSSNDFFILSNQSGASSQGPALASLSGPLLIDTGSTFSGMDRVLGVFDGSILTGTSPNALIQLNASTVTTGSNAISVSSGTDQIPGTMTTLGGSLLSATNGTTFNPSSPAVTAAFIFVGDSAILNGPPKPAAVDAPALVNFNNSNLCPSPCIANTTFSSTRRSLTGENPTQLNLGGALLSAAGSNFSNSTFIAVQEGARLTGTGTGALVQTTTTPSTITTTGNFMTINDLSTGTSAGTANPANVNLDGGILSDTSGSTFNIGSQFLSLSIPGGTSGSSITSTTSDAAFALNNSTANVGSNFAQISGENSKVTLSGSLLSANNSTLNIGTDPTVSGDVLDTNARGQLVVNSAQSILNFNGGTHVVGTADATANNTANRIARIQGDTTAAGTDAATGLGTFQPVIGSGATPPAFTGAPNPVGSLIEATNGALITVNAGTTDGTTGAATTANGLTAASVFAGNAIQIDRALFEATLPMINLIGGIVTPTTLTTAGGTMDLYQSKVVSNGSPIALDKGIINVNNGPLLTLRNGSSMDVTGDLLRLTNGSKINVVNGPLIFVTGSAPTGTNANRTSFLNVSGALVNFGGTGGNQIIVNNSIAPTATLSGIPVSNAGGGGAISITNPVKNPSLGTINVTGSLIQTTNGGRVTISGN